MLEEEMPVSSGHKKWCRWTAGILVLCTAVGFAIHFVGMFGFKVLLAVLALVLFLFVAQKVRAARRPSRPAAHVVELRPNPYDRN